LGQRNKGKLELRVSCQVDPCERQVLQSGNAWSWWLCWLCSTK